MAKEGDNSFGTVSFIFGLLGLLFSIVILPAIPLGILGIIFGFVQRKKEKNAWSTWGIALSILGLIVAIIIAIILFRAATAASQEYQKCMADPTLPECANYASLLQQQGLGSSDLGSGAYGQSAYDYGSTFGSDNSTTPDLGATP